MLCHCFDRFLFNSTSFLFFGHDSFRCLQTLFLTFLHVITTSSIEFISFRWKYHSRSLDGEIVTTSLMFSVGWEYSSCSAAEAASHKCLLISNSALLEIAIRLSRRDLNRAELSSSPHVFS